MKPNNNLPEINEKELNKLLSPITNKDIKKLAIEMARHQWSIDNKYYQDTVKKLEKQIDEMLNEANDL